MKERLRQLPAVFVAFFMVPLSLMPARASDAWVYWDSTSAFSTTYVTINAGDYVNIANNEDPGGFTVTITGDPPESFSVTLDPQYYYPHQYNAPGTFSFSDNWYGETVYVQVNSLQPVSVVITDPTNHTALTAPATFTIAAQPSGGTSPYYVEFLVGTNSLGYDYAAPFSSTVTNVPAGTYDISAIATDYNFYQATNTITITVNPLVLGYPRTAGGKLVFDLSGLTLGKTNILQSSGNLSSWSDLNTNVATSISTTITNSVLTGSRFFRVVQLP